MAWGCLLNFVFEKFGRKRNDIWMSRIRCMPVTSYDLRNEIAFTPPLHMLLHIRPHHRIIHVTYALRTRNTSSDFYSWCRWDELKWSGGFSLFSLSISWRNWGVITYITLHCIFCPVQRASERAFAKGEFLTPYWCMDRYHRWIDSGWWLMCWKRRPF